MSGEPLETLLADPGRFVVAVEVEPGRGRQLTRNATDPARRALDLAAVDGIDLMCVTDNAGGHPQLRPETLARQLADAGHEVSVTVSCKDLNRDGLESRLWEAGSLGYRNLIAVSGDYPAPGELGGPRPVFDLDSVGLLELVRIMNERDGMDFFPGAVVNPFKWSESEAVPQYQKLALKVQCGARFAVSQIGFEARKHDELVRVASANGIRVPLIGSVFLLGLPSARAFRRGAIPGVTMPDGLLQRSEQEAASPDRGRAFFEDLAARQVALLRGLGYRGVYLSGFTSPERLGRVMATANAFAGDDWRAAIAEFPERPRRGYYCFEKDQATGLNSGTPAVRGTSRHGGPGGRARRGPLPFALGRIAHRRVFQRGSKGYRAARYVYSKLEASRSPLLGGLHRAEYGVKAVLYGCRDCGDCSLPETAYLCPESQCVKNQRNGPCGGTRNGRCEVNDRHCVWVRAYHRLRARGEAARMLDRPPVIKDARLQGTSSWANAFMGRDHTASRGIKSSDGKK